MSLFLGCLGNPSDPYFSSVTLLMHFNGVNGGTSFPDNSSYARTVTPNGSVNTSTTNYKFPTASALFDGSGDYLTSSYISSDFDWWPGDFTIEALVYATSWSTWSYVDGSANPVMIGCAVVSSFTNDWSFGPRSDGTLCFYYYNGASANRVFGGTLPINQWNHIAMVKNISGITLYINGVSVSGPTIISGTPISSQPGVVLTIGQINNTSITGNVDELRISKVARYTSNFTPPIQPFPNY